MDLEGCSFGGRIASILVSMNVALPRRERLVPASKMGKVGPYRRQDYDALPDEPRCELIWGKFHLSPSPTLVHQLVASTLRERLDALVEPAGGMALAAPLDVPLAVHSVVQPDVIVLRAATLAAFRRREAVAPELLVEVLSPGTARLDRGEKLALYAACGVGEYWLIDPVTQDCQFLINAGDRFTSVVPPDSPYQSPFLDEVHLDLDRFWRKITSRLSP